MRPTGGVCGQARLMHDSPASGPPGPQPAEGDHCVEVEHDPSSTDETASKVASATIPLALVEPVQHGEDAQRADPSLTGIFKRPRGRPRKKPGQPTEVYMCRRCDVPKKGHKCPKAFDVQAKELMMPAPMRHLGPESSSIIAGAVMAASRIGQGFMPCSSNGDPMGIAGQITAAAAAIAAAAVSSALSGHVQPFPVISSSGDDQTFVRWRGSPCPHRTTRRLRLSHRPR